MAELRRITGKARDPISFLTHFLGGIASVIAVIFLLMRGIASGSPRVLISGLIFGLSMTALYFASAGYHYSTGSPDHIRRLRKLDHSMICVLIAGTYTPILLCVFSQPNGTVFTALMWLFAAAGILISLFWINAPRFLTTALYVAMGWAILLDLPSLGSLHTGGIVWLALGGVLYTAGAVIYALKKPKLTENFGFHELFHIFILLGSICHFICIYHYVML